MIGPPMIGSASGFDGMVLGGHFCFGSGIPGVNGRAKSHESSGERFAVQTLSKRNLSFGAVFLKCRPLRSLTEE